MKSQDPIPRHVGIIMDGNRRWADKKGLSVLEGHTGGYRALKALLPALKRSEIEYLSVWAFSTENWSRSVSEVKGLMNLLRRVLTNELHVFMENDIRLIVVGSEEQLSTGVKKSLRSAEHSTAHNKSGTLVVCFNYGGQQEIIDATKKLIQTGVKSTELTAEKFVAQLYAPKLPPVDLIIRTSGEQRTSGFMLWQAAYAELYFMDKYWPEFTEADLGAALTDYAKRQRRFGK